LGFYYDKNKTIFGKQENIVLRTNYDSINDHNIKYVKNKNFFLISSIFKGNTREHFYNVDILTIQYLYGIKSLLKKYNGRNIGIEFLISDIRYRDSSELGKWFFDMKWIYELCKKYDFQFILSSGANNYTELISLKVFNILLEKMDIENRKYWQDLEYWLDQKKSAYIYDSG
jgi:RNase P/RNase MRP subunit p30